MPEDAAPATGPDAWVDAHADVLFRYALTRLRRRQDAEDAVQETLLAALRGRQSFRGDSAERTWLVGILRHKIVDRIRAAARDDGERLADDGEEGAFDSGLFQHWRRPPGRWLGDPAQLSEDNEFWMAVRHCFGSLPERQAHVFALRTFDQLEAEEICKQTGITATNLWVLLHRARLRLRACLEGNWFAKEEAP